MHSLTVVFGPSATNWRLLFKSAEAAQAQMHYLSIDTGGVVGRITLVDDFGQKACLDTRSIHGWMLENMDESKIGAVEYHLHETRLRATIQQRVESDPTIRAAAMSRGPAILNPMGNGRMS